MVSFLALYIIGKYFVAHFLSWVSDARSHETFVGSVLLIVASAAYLTHALGLSYSLGAFFAGLMIAETKYRYQVEADLIPFRDTLLGLFFVTVGMQIEVSFLLAHLGEALGLTAALIIIKSVVVILLIRFSQPWHVAFKTGLSLAQGGGFSFAVFASASDAGMMSADNIQLLIIVVAISMALTPFILNNLQKLTYFLEPKPGEFTTLPAGSPEIEKTAW